MNILKVNLILISILLLASCRKENTPENADDDFMKSSTDVLVGQSNFAGSGRYDTEGTAKFYTRKDDKLLRLENFETDNGPALKVYIASDESATEFIDLGDLKAVTGNQSYTISKDIDLSKYPYVLIWCQQFSVLFGSAQIN